MREPAVATRSAFTVEIWGQDGEEGQYDGLDVVTDTDQRAIVVFDHG